MKKALPLAVLTLAMLTAAAFMPATAHAQQVASPFADVPMEHWAYASVEKLRNAGIVIGYPNGTYAGQRPMTRYEFAVAMGRFLDKLTLCYPLPEDIVRRNELSRLATKDDLAELRKLLESFRTERKSLSSGLDDVKKRVDTLDGEHKGEAKKD